MFQKSLNNHQILFYLWPSAGIKLPLLLPPIANPTYETYNINYKKKKLFDEHERGKD